MIIEVRRRAELAARVKIVLTEAGIGRRSHARALCEILDIARTQAYGKLNGEVDFTLPQVAAIEKKFGVELLHVVAASNEDAPDRSLRQWVNALLLIGDRTVRCHIILGAAWHDPGRHSLAGYLDRGQWMVCLFDAAPAETPLFEVNELSWLAKAE